MTTSLQHPYVVFHSEQDDYLFMHPQSGQLVTGSAFDNANNHPPAHFEQELAELLAREMNQLKGDPTSAGWSAVLTYKDCPSCGRDLWANDLDVCYPSNRERTRWRVGCNCHDFGCGLEVLGESYDDAVSRWNNHVLYADRPAGYVVPTGRRQWEQEELLKQALFAGSAVEDDAFVERVKEVSENTASPLQYVAQHYLTMAQRRQNG